MHGGGVFAVENIDEGEMLVRWGGQVYTTKQLEDGETNDQTACQIDEELHIASPAGTPLIDADLMNHSCDPNTWMADEVTIVARRPISVGEEVTADYAEWVAYPDYETIKDCKCGSLLCRHLVTGNDWRLPVLQERYKGHWPPYLAKRIERI